MKNLIAFVGYPRSGKDAAADYLVEHHGYTRIAFGDAVKSLLMTIDPVYGNDLEDLERCKADGRLETREKLQNLGEAMRDFDPDFWIKTARKNMKKLQEGAKVVITDIRYQNEFHMVKDMGGEVIGIRRPGRGPVNDHVTEQNTATLLDHADRSVTNDSTIPAMVACILGSYEVHG